MRLILVIAGALLLAACTATRAPPPAANTYATAQPSADVRDAQQQLQNAGFYNGPVDGVWGPETRAAVERFQRAEGVPVTVQLDDSTRIAMRRAGGTAALPLSDPTDVRAVQNRLRQLGYYNGPADGVWGRDTQAAMERFQRARGLPVGQANRATVTAMGLDSAAFSTRTAAAPVVGEPLDPPVVRGIQRRLRQLGYYRGPVDGTWGSRTQTALANFQRSRGLEATGTLNPTTVSALGFDPNNLSRSVAQAPVR